MDENTDLFFFQRNSTEESLKLIFHLRQGGVNVIYDIDDDILHIPLSNPVSDLYFKSPKVPWSQLMSIRFASLVTVSTPALVDLYSRINPNVVLIENWLDKDDWAVPVDALLTKDRVRIFWGGSPTHKNDLVLLGPVFERVKQKHPEVEFIIMGDQISEYEDLVSTIPFGPYKFFQRVQRSCQIGIAPMEDSLFNRAKSDLRIKELAASGMAVVASPVGEYAGYDDFCLYAKDTDGWVYVLCALIESKTEREEYARRAEEWSKTQYLCDHIDQWTNAFERLLPNGNRAERGDIGQVVRVQDPSRLANVPAGGKVRVGGVPHS